MVSIEETLKRIEELNRAKRSNDEAIRNAQQGMLNTLNVGTQVTQCIYDTPQKITLLQRDFEKKTELNKLDQSIMFVAIGLQILRQFFQHKLSLPEERMDDQTAAGAHEYSKEERNRGYYNPSLEEILTKPVPFDVIDGANGEFKGSGFFGHRGKTVGHDPILGLIVGTANIATSTVTIAEGNFIYKSYHVRTNERNRDCFAENADTVKVFERTIDKVIKNSGGDGRARVAASFVQEIIHLKSDMYSKKSLPLPVITTISPEFAGWLANHGVDCANVLYVLRQLAVIGEQAALAALINYIISIYHGLFYDGKTEKDKKLYEVKTKKIVTYSNLVASSINLGQCGFHLYKGDIERAIETLDLGGLCVTIYSLIKNTEFINKVRHEFVIGEFESDINKLMENLYVS